MNWFKRSLVVGAVAAGLMLGGCAQPGGSGRSSSSGSLALSSDDRLLYAVDTDNGTLTVLDTQTDAKVATIKVGELPGRVVVGSDDTIYVTNRGSNSVSVIRKGEWKEVAQVAVGTEPVGLAVSPDNQMLYVVNSTSSDATEFGTLTGIDVATLQPTFEVKVGAEPRGLALLGNDKAVVTLYKQGELVEVDLKAKAVLSGGIGIYNAANATRTSGTGGLGSASFSTFKPRAMTAVAATSDGTRLFAPVIWAREDPIGRRPSASGGYYSSGGPCNIGAVATAGLVVADQGAGPSGGALQPQVDDLTNCVSSGTVSQDKDFPTSTLTGRPVFSGGSSSTAPIQAPVAVAIDSTDSFVYLVNKESSNVAVVPAFRRAGDGDFAKTGSSVRSLIQLNSAPDTSSGPDGIALTRDGTKAYVYNQFDHRVDVLRRDGEGDAAQILKVGSIPVAGDVLSPEVVAGRKMFFNATDRRISSASTNVSCASCHLEGLEDGHVWSFPDGPRQTPALAGRKLRQTQPYHWSGEFSDAQSFMKHTIIERMGGTGLVTAKESENLVDFIEAIPAPQNPYVKAVRTDAQLRGAMAFQKAQCAGCHSGALLTNKLSADVGTLVVSGTRNPDNGIVVQPVDAIGTRRGLDVPSLLGVARTSPYLHTGSATTLEERINDNPGDKHGLTSVLSTDEKADLVAYLKSL
ncbi:MAG: collagen triple helix repeat domain protein [Myxococcaceae bacterium]|nr:collagen triple helix repeat domain protein [Myxococcaceae bacterium]